MSPSSVSENLREVRLRIESACTRAGRPLSAVRLIAVTKEARPEWIAALIELGVVDLGENRPQQLLERAAAFSSHDVRWHLVGHLQRNKARRVLPVAAVVHSVDSFRLLEALERLAGETGTCPRVLLQVNVSGETAKHGFDPRELAEGYGAVRACRRVRIDGLMTMAPWAGDPEESRPVFRALRELRDRLADASDGALPLAELSMGMSGDFEPAIEEGATCVRIGTALFEGL